MLKIGGSAWPPVEEHQRKGAIVCFINRHRSKVHVMRAVAVGRRSWDVKNSRVEQQWRLRGCQLFARTRARLHVLVNFFYLSSRSLWPCFNFTASRYRDSLSTRSFFFVPTVKLFYFDVKFSNFSSTMVNLI